jgi:zeaxanthin glucosyltransferase
MKVAFTTTPAPGHINPMTTLARSLQARDVEVVFITIPDGESFVRSAELNFIPVCDQEYPAGEARRLFRELDKVTGDEALHLAFKFRAAVVESTLKHLPKVLSAAKVDALVLDTAQYFLELVPIQLGMPYVQVSNALPIDWSGYVPPPRFFDWPHETTAEARARNLRGLAEIRSLHEPFIAVARRYADQFNLDVDWNDMYSTYSKLAWLTQLPKEFDFEGIPWPPCFHYSGPFHNENKVARVEGLFPWERLTGEPLIYASMGTLQGNIQSIFQKIVEASETFPDFQLVVATGIRVDVEKIKTASPKTIIVTYAPQIELLKRAALCISHAGLNTTLEALAAGVPMIAIPLTNDQPGVAARLVYHRAGRSIPLKELSSSALSYLMSSVMADVSYSSRAHYFQEVIKKSNGLDTATTLIERAFG